MAINVSCNALFFDPVTTTCGINSPRKAEKPLIAVFQADIVSLSAHSQVFNCIHCYRGRKSPGNIMASKPPITGSTWRSSLMYKDRQDKQTSTGSNSEIVSEKNKKKKTTEKCQSVIECDDGLGFESMCMLHFTANQSAGVICLADAVGG